MYGKVTLHCGIYGYLIVKKERKQINKAMAKFIGRSPQHIQASTTGHPEGTKENWV
jgi:hypothetical protein